MTNDIDDNKKKKKEEVKSELTIDELSRESSRDYIRKNERVTYLDE
jgi:hypothetical protein